MVFGLSGAATLWTDYLWYRSMTLSSVWQINLVTSAALVAVATVIAFAALWLNLVVANRLSPRIQLLTLTEDDELVVRFHEWMEPRVTRVQLIASLAFGLLMGASAAAWRDEVLLFLNPVPFGVTDPIFQRDISFFVFQLPVWREIQSWLFNVTGLVLLLVLVAHYLNGGIRLRRGSAPDVGSGVKVHISVLLAVLALIRAVGYRLDGWELVTSDRGFTGVGLTGAGYTDVTSRLPALNLLALISVAAAVLLVINIWRRGWLLPAVALGGWLVVSLVVGTLIPAAVQRFRVVPQERDLESPYIGHNIEFTRLAYGLDGVTPRQFPATETLTAEDIVANEETISNVRLWDPTVIRSTYANVQELRAYYNLPDVDVDRYTLDGQVTQLMVAARHLDEENLPSDSWQASRLEYTHGYGMVISPANDVAEGGQPDFLVKDLPPVAESEELAVAQPGIYFADSYASERPLYVGTRTQEVDYPLPTEESSAPVRTQYSGEAGVPIGDVFRRAAFAIRYRDLNVLISSQLTSETRALMVRNVEEMVHKAAPFLYADHDPYPVVIDGRVLWVIDLYTVSSDYPYSQQAISGFTSTLARRESAWQLPDSFNYIRNSVKATVDAYDGTLTFYVVDETDPLINAYRQVYPEVFAGGEQVPEALRSHFRYPEDLFRVQSRAWLRYHVPDVPTFYIGEDAWQIPSDPTTNTETAEVLRGDRPLGGGRLERIDVMLPYYLLTEIPGDDSASFVIQQPFTPQGRQNLTALLVARSDPEGYGELIDLRFPQGQLVDGPTQVSARIDQDDEISAQFTLWGQQGSTLIRGNMLITPIEDSVVYFQPIYLQDQQNPLPEYRRVVVVYGDQVVMRPGLREALIEVFGGQETPTEPEEGGEEQPPGVDSTVLGLLQEAEDLFEQAEEELQAGNLGEYQRLINEARERIQLAAELSAPPSEDA